MHRFNRASVVCVGLALLLSAPIASGAGPSKTGAYRDASLKAFYFFGEETFESFSCALKVDVLEGLIKGLKEQFAGAKLPLVLKETTDAFQVTFSRKTDEATFVEPSLSVVIPPGSTLADPEQVKAGIQQIEGGYERAVAGAVQIVRGAFDEFEKSRFAKYSEIGFKANKKGYEATFNKDGAEVQESFDGEVRRLTFQIK